MLAMVASHPRGGGGAPGWIRTSTVAGFEAAAAAELGDRRLLGGDRFSTGEHHGPPSFTGDKVDGGAGYRGGQPVAAVCCDGFTFMVRVPGRGVEPRVSALSSRRRTVGPPGREKSWGGEGESNPHFLGHNQASYRWTILTWVCRQMLEMSASGGT